MSEQTFRVYALTDPDGAPRYVGQTAHPLGIRLASHLRVRGHSGRADWIRSLLASDREPGIALLEEITGTRGDAYTREAFWIRNLRNRGHNLLNVP